MITRLSRSSAMTTSLGDTELYNSWFGTKKKYNMSLVRWSVVGERTLWTTGLDEMEMDE